MLEKKRLISALLVASLVFVGSCSLFAPKASARADLLLTVGSRQDNGASSNLGQVQFSVTTNNLPFIGGANGPFPKGPFTLIYYPAAGYYFVKWQTLGPVAIGDVNAASTTITFQGSGEATISAMYSTTRPGVVGGVVLPHNTLTVLAPYLVVIGLAATAAVAAKKRRN